MSDLTALTPAPAPEVMEIFWSRVAEDGECWVWTRGLNTEGYGVWSPPKFTALGQGVAHRFAYRHMVGEIPSGLQLDHLCRNRRCVNPDHLEPVTPLVNTMRGETSAARNAAKTHCDRGHEFNAENTYVWVSGSGTHRHCKPCKAAEKRARRARTGSA